MIYIYALIDPRTRGVRYVGQSVDPERRYTQHVTATEDTPKGVWIRELRSLGLEPDLIILGNATDQQQANYLETWWMLVGWRQGWGLTNGTKPGEWRVVEDFKIIFAKELAQTSAEGMKQVVFDVKSRFLHYTICAVSTPFVLIGVIYFVFRAIEHPGFEYLTLWVGSSVMWLMALGAIYVLSSENILTVKTRDNIDTFMVRLAYIGVVVSMILFGLISVADLFVKWGLVTI